MVATIKVRNFHAVKEVLENFGVVPADALKRVGLDPNLFANKENVVLYADAARLVEECARLTNCDDFGLRVGMRQDASAMGLTGLLSLSAAKVGEALQFVVAGLKTSDTGGVFAFEARNGAAFSAILWLMAPRRARSISSMARWRSPATHYASSAAPDGGPTASP